VIDWSQFFEIEGHPTSHPQPANLLDTKIALAVVHLPKDALPKGPKLLGDKVVI